MKKLLHIITSVVISYFVCGIAAPAMAENGENYIAMLREDRVWEYWMFATVGNPTDVYFTMKVIGTKTINEKEYKVFSFERMLTFEERNENAVKSDIFYNGDTTKFFLREEGGKVFELTYGDFVFTAEEQISEMEVPENGAGGNYFNERVLYDATAPNGSIVMVPDNMSLYIHEMFQEPMLQYYGEEICIGDENCRLVGWYTVTDEANQQEEYPTLGYGNYGRNGWIEGIGVLELGILPCFNLDRMAGAMAKSSPMGEISGREPLLYSVYTTDGELLYGNEPVCAGVKTLPDTQLSLRNADGRICASGVGNVMLTVTGLDGTEVASASGSGEASIPTTSLGRGVYVVTASYGATKRIMKIRL